MISTQSLKRAAYVTIIYVVITIPILLLTVFLAFAEVTGSISGFASRFISAMTTVIGVVLYVYVLSSLRSLLEERFSFNAVSALIAAIISLNIALAVLMVLAVPFAAIETPVGIISLLALVALGIIYIVIGAKLLALNNTLYGMLKPFSYTFITAGACYATIIFTPVGILVGMANMIILAIIFFRAIEDVAKLDAGNRDILHDGQTESGQ